MATFFIGSPAFDEVHLAEHCVARADVLIEACSVEGQSRLDLMDLIQSRLDLMTLGWIGSIGRAANARKLDLDWTLLRGPGGNFASNSPGLGNEMWGHWQVGRLTAEEYVARARSWAYALRRVDRSIELVGCARDWLE